MKVISPGFWQDGFSTQLDCTGYGWGGNGCGALLLVEKSDLCYVAITDQDGNSTGEREAVFICPQCGQTTRVRDVPDNVLHSLPSRDKWRVTKQADTDDEYERRHY